MIGCTAEEAKRTVISTSVRPSSSGASSNRQLVPPAFVRAAFDRGVKFSLTRKSVTRPPLSIIPEAIPNVAR